MDRSPIPIRSLARPRRAHAPVAPVVGSGDTISPELDRALTDAALAARAGDRAARNALYFALEPKIAAHVARYRRLLRERLPLWEPDDLAQEAFLVFAELVTEWPGDGTFAPFFLRRFPLRLHRAVRQLEGPRFTRVSASRYRLELLADESAAAAEANALLAALAARLDPLDARILVGRILERESFTALSRRLRLDPQMLRRRWLIVLETLRASLSCSEWTRHGGSQHLQ